jgi:XPG I-region
MGLESVVLLFGAFMPLITCSEFLRPPNDGDFIRVALDASALIHPLLRRHMHNLIEPVPDWFDFRQSLKTHLLRLISLHNNRVLLWVVADGTRIDAKLANADRARDRDQAEIRMIEQLAAGLQPADSVISKAIGKLGPKAVEILREVCAELKVVFTVAPCEAEHEITRLQRDKKVDAILCNDSDYAMLRCTNIIFDRNGSLWTQPSLLWEGPELLDHPNNLCQLLMKSSTEPLQILQALVDLDKDSTQCWRLSSLEIVLNDLHKVHAVQSYTIFCGLTINIIVPLNF